jgi:hypothetical protein
MKNGRRIKSFSGEMMVYKRRLILHINERAVDISSLLPTWVFKIKHMDTNHPTTNCKIRKEMVKTARLYMMRNYPEFPSNKIHG